jgi:hypothetical protein
MPSVPGLIVGNAKELASLAMAELVTGTLVVLLLEVGEEVMRVDI